MDWEAGGVPTPDLTTEEEGPGSSGMKKEGLQSGRLGGWGVVGFWMFLVIQDDLA